MDVIDLIEAVDDPAAAAELSAEALRAVNRLTLGPPSPGKPTWSEISDLYLVIDGLRLLVDRLPQAFAQLASHLEAPGAGTYRSDGGTTESPEALVATAVTMLNTATSDVRLLASALAGAQAAVSHLRA